MSTPSPLLPPAALEGVDVPKSRIRITVLTILALHVVFIGGLLLQGCKENNRNNAASDHTSNALSSLPPLAESTYISNIPPDLSASAAIPAASPSEPLTSPSTGSARPSPSTSSLEPRSQAFSTGQVTEPNRYSRNSQSSPLAAPESSSTSQAMGLTTEHTIKKGDTIGDLAKKYGVSEHAILDANPAAKPRSLKIGDKLTIPAPAKTLSASSATGQSAANEAAAAGAGEVYLVKNGDTLTKISKQFGVTIKQLRMANNMHGDRLLPKQRLVIPAKAVNLQETKAPTSGTNL